MELIKREAAKAKIAEMILGASDFANDMRQTCCDAIDAAPTIEAVPVVHGRWTYPLGMAWVYVCSECGKNGGVIKSPYCPSCGARMDVEEAQQ